jgi:transposase-like protein
MGEYPMTFNEFVSRFLTEEQCLEYLFQLRWGGGFECPKCKGKDYWKVNGTLYTCKTCRHQASVLAGTVFQGTRKSLRDWFVAIWWLTTQKYGASAQGLQQVLGLGSYQSAWTWLHKIRTAMINPARTKLSGTVEIDESYIGGEEEGAHGRETEKKALVIAAVEIKGEKLGRVRISRISDASKDSIQPFITANVEFGSELVTDAWSGYFGIEKHGYTRIMYNQSKATKEDEMLPHVHLIISLLKRWLLGTHQGAVGMRHLQAYLDEYVFRFNRRKSAKRGLLFYRLLENAMLVPPTTYNELVGKTSADEF